jgi:starch-binding outer membrane protein, SusD/RagB family
MNKYKIQISMLLGCMIIFSCANQLDVKNPNLPTASTIKSENDILSLGLGAYFSGWTGNKYAGFVGTFLTDVISYHSGMGDEIGVEAANVYINQLVMPDWVQLDNNSKVNNPANPNTQLGLLRLANVNAQAGQNPVYYEWSYVYALNNHCNAILANVDKITFSGDIESKKNTIRAWAYWWKGYCYSRIGSMYVAGIINDEVGVTNNRFVDRQAIIAESNSSFDKAIAAINAVTITSDYTKVMQAIIPSMNQVGKGTVPTQTMWVRNINTMKARNILINTKASVMTSAQWNQVLSLANNGILSSDNIFIGRSNSNGDFISSTTGNVALLATGDPTASTYKVSERLVQDFKAGDRRFINNFKIVPSGGGVWRGNSDRGNVFNTRWSLIDNSSGTGPAGAGVVIYANSSVGEGETFLAGTYEENELMKAEANLYLGNLAGAGASIDAVRNYQGAGLTVTPTPDVPTVKEELRRERRVALAFRGLAFYDARRWSIIDPVSAGGGRAGAVVIDRNGVVSTNATINYNFLDYWDVPDNEIVYNKPSADSAPVTNPRLN